MLSTLLSLIKWHSSILFVSRRPAFVTSILHMIALLYVWFKCSRWLHIVYRRRPRLNPGSLLAPGYLSTLAQLQGYDRQRMRRAMDSVANIVSYSVVAHSHHGWLLSKNSHGCQSILKKTMIERVNALSMDMYTNMAMTTFNGIKHTYAIYQHAHAKVFCWLRLMPVVCPLYTFREDITPYNPWQWCLEITETVLSCRTRA